MYFNDRCYKLKTLNFESGFLDASTDVTYIITMKDSFKRHENIMNQLKDKDINNKNEGELIFNDEDHTIGNLLNRFLQDHDNIIFSGYKMEHLLINNVSINYKTNGAKNINEIINLSIKNIINIINYIIKLLK